MIILISKISDSEKAGYDWDHNLKYNLISAVFQQNSEDENRCLF